MMEDRRTREDRMREQEVRAYRQYEKKVRRRQVGVFCFHLGVALIFFSCCIFALTHKPEPDVLTVIRDVPVPMDQAGAPGGGETVAGETAQPLATKEPYGCGVPLAGTAQPSATKEPYGCGVPLAGRTSKGAGVDLAAGQGEQSGFCEDEVAPDVSEDQDGPSDAAVALARTVWGEARGCSTTEQAAVAWCVLNRVDSPEFPDDVVAVCSQRTETVKQFDGYDPGNPVEPELLALAEDVLARWELEKLGVGSVGRVLPADYLFFEGDGVHNSFRRTYIKVGQTWDWSLPSPYKVNDAEGGREGPLGGGG